MSKKIYTFLLNRSTIQLIILSVLANLFFSIIFSIISNSVSESKLTNGFRDFSSIYQEIFAGIIFAPIFETLIFQYLIIEYFVKRKSVVVSCLISALTFGLFHTYNFFYFLFAFASGFLFAALYIIGKERRKGIIIVLFSHMIYNLVVFILKNSGL